MTDIEPPARPLRVLRVIARLNVGGPARHVTTLDEGLKRRGLDPLLVYGSVGSFEASLQTTDGGAACASPSKTSA